MMTDYGKVIIDCTSCGYYFIRIGSSWTDDEVAEIIDMNEIDYKRHLINEFDGFEEGKDNRYENEAGVSGEIFFDNIENARNALDWVTSLYIARKLGGK